MYRVQLAYWIFEISGKMEIFLFESTVLGCYPAALNRASNQERTLYFNAKNGPFPPEVFQPDPICLKQTIMIHGHYPTARLFRSLLTKKKI
jgi:hypothetical protein